jgi:hypothetical protein
MVRFGLALMASWPRCSPHRPSAAPPRRESSSGKSLGGLALGATALMSAPPGNSSHVCRDCRAQTWYFNLKPFEPQGAG